MLLQLEAVESGSWNRPVTLQINLGETVLLLGRNGAGKTTLLNTIAGLLPVRSGRLLIDGRVFSSAGNRQNTAAVRIALEGRQVFGRLSVRKNLLLGAFARKQTAEIAKDLDWVLEVFPDLNQKLELPAKTLSGGQQTMLNIGRALMGRPKLLLLDEPTLGLAPQSVNKLIHTVDEIRSHRQVAIIVAEQGGAFPRAFPQRILLMVGGEILFDGHWELGLKNGVLSEVFV